MNRQKFQRIVMGVLACVMVLALLLPFVADIILK